MTCLPAVYGKRKENRGVWKGTTTFWQARSSFCCEQQFLDTDWMGRLQAHGLRLSTFYFLKELHLKRQNSQLEDLPFAIILL